MSKLPRYVSKRSNSKYLWFQLKVPKEFRVHEGGKEVVAQSLRTTDVIQAGIDAGRIRSEYFKKWEGGGDETTISDQAIVPTHADMLISATKIGYDEFSTAIAELRSDKTKDSNEAWNEYVTSLESKLVTSIRLNASGDNERFVTLAKNRIKKLDWKLDEDSEEFETFVKMISEGAIEAIRVQLQHGKGNLAAEPTSSVVIAGKQAESQTAKDGETLLELFEQFSNRKMKAGKKTQASVDQDRKVVELFSDFIGRQRAVDSITRTEIVEFRNLLEKTPANRNKLKAFRELSWKDAVQKAASTDVKLLQNKTINRYLSALSKPFTAFVSEHRMAVNPCTGLFLETDKNSRPPFTVSQLNTIFTSPLFVGFRSNWKAASPGDMMSDDWKYWLPLACFFTGARVAEIAQLRIADVQQADNDINYLKIAHELENGLHTKSKVTRPAALHSKFIELGFLAFVRRRRMAANGDGDAPLFPELRPINGEEIGAKASKWFGRYLKRIGIKANGGSDGLGLHSFRHTISDRLRELEVLDNEVAIALGHKLSTVTSGYGKITQGTVSWHSKIIEKLTFDDINLEELTSLSVNRAKRKLR